MSRLESEPRRFPLYIQQGSDRTIDKAAPPQEPVYPIEYMEKALAAFEDSPSLGVMLQNAKVLMQGREFGLASHLLIEVLRRDPGNELSIRQLGECYFQLKDWEKAEKILKVAADMSPTTYALMKYAEVMYVRGKNHEALEVFCELLLDIGEDTELLFKVYKFIGNIYVRLGDLDSAEENYNKAFTLNPRSDVLLVNYGTLEIQRGQVQQALERYRQAVDINDQNEKAWVGLALIHREYGDFELGWGNLHKALDLDPENVTALQMMSDWAVKDYRLPEAIERLQKYLTLNDRDAQKSFLLAKLFFISGQKNLAQLEVTRALNFEPNLSGGVEFLQALQQKDAQ